MPSSDLYCQYRQGSWTEGSNSPQAAPDLRRCSVSRQCPQLLPQICISNTHSSARIDRLCHPRIRCWNSLAERDTSRCSQSFRVDNGGVSDHCVGNWILYPQQVLWSGISEEEEGSDECLAARGKSDFQARSRDEIFLLSPSFPSRFFLFLANYSKKC